MHLVLFYLKKAVDENVVGKHQGELFSQTGFFGFHQSHTVFKGVERIPVGCQQALCRSIGQTVEITGEHHRSLTGDFIYFSKQERGAHHTGVFAQVTKVRIENEEDMSSLQVHKLAPGDRSWKKCSPTHAAGHIRGFRKPELRIGQELQTLRRIKNGTGLHRWGEESAKIRKTFVRVQLSG